MTNKPNFTEEEARELLNLEENKWIIQVNDEQLAALKSAVRNQADILRSLATEIESIG